MDNGDSVALYVSRPSLIEAVRWTGSADSLNECRRFAGDKIHYTSGCLSLRAGADGAQDWVTVPHGHWLVSQPGDRSDIWPVENAYFEAKYQPPKNGRRSDDG